MSISETNKAQKYASQAEVSAAECAIYANVLKGAPNYAAQAAASASAANQSASLAASSAAGAQEYANSASSSAASAFESAQEAGNAAAAAVGQCIRVPSGELTSPLPVAADRKQSALVFDADGNSSVKPLSGFALLDSDGKIPASQIPSIAISHIFVVSSEAEMLSLDAYTGDVAKRTDLGFSLMLSQTPASTLGNWVRLNDDVLAELAQPTGSDLIGSPYGTLTDVAEDVQNKISTAIANKTFKHSVKISDYSTLQDASSAAVDGLLIDVDYNFIDGESVDFGSKVLTIFCKAKFIGDGKLTFTNLGAGSCIIYPHMQSLTVPYVISRWDSNGEWINNPSTIISTITQSRTQGYAPTVNDVDIYSLLPDNVKNQNVISHLVLVNSSGTDVFYPKATFGSYESLKNNNVRFWYPRDFYGDMSNCIAFTAWDSTDYYHGNYVIGGSTNYGSYSGVCFYRNDGGVSHDGGVIGGFSPYRCGESGVKTYQNEVNSISQRCYNLRFSDIYPTETYYDGVDLNADYGTPTERQHDYTLAQYSWNNLPTNHLVSNVQAYKTHGVGIWGDGSTGSYVNVTSSYAQGVGIHIKGTGKNFKNLTSIQSNMSNSSSENQVALEGANIIDGISIINYTQPLGMAIYAPNSTVTNITAPSVPASAININNIEGLYVGNMISVQPNKTTQTSAIYLNQVSSSVPSRKEDVSKITTGTSETARYVVSGGSPRIMMRENHGDFGAVNIAFSGTILPDEAVPDANSYAVYWDGTNLTALINHGGVLTRQKLTT
ncbi:hypothetical protein FPF80_00780 [Salmonella enterica subsp. enterica]|nr:hypothetical protein [Salmonella enterica subsp. enterica serovar Typhimurium]ECH1286307.1 hypothetical protein [Salmonella enterica subsp. enterica serovar Typhimurium]ECK0315803.1 hypothetical protein [Salmonella enterica subsp. enterica serovar Typhimurium]ECR1805879.1 hypothetical protein [Salmonella enterica subsp. enterica serovar Typhimurium]